MMDEQVFSDTEELILVCPDRKDYMKKEKQHLSPEREGGILGLRYLKRTTETVVDEGKADSQELKCDPQANPEVELNATERR